MCGRYASSRGAHDLASWFDTEEPEEELDLFETGDLDMSEKFLNDVYGALDVEPGTAVRALGEVAAALTRASLLAAAEAADGDDEDEDEDGPAANGHV